MANIMWIIPTQNKEDFFNTKKLVKLLNNNIPQLQFTYRDDANRDDAIYFEIIVHDKKNNALFGINVDRDCYLINKEADIKELDERGEEDMADQLVYFWDSGPDINRCIEMRHTHYTKEQRMVTDFCRKYFKAYIFDEGIHPEFVKPWGAYPTDVEPTIRRYWDFVFRK